MATQQRSQQYPGLVERVASLGRSQWKPEIEKRLAFVSELADFLNDHVVEQESITPVEATGIIACAAGQVTGYAQFHGQPTGVDMMQALSSSPLSRDPGQ